MRTKYIVLLLSYIAALMFTLIYLLIYIRQPSFGFNILIVASVIFAVISIPYGYFDEREIKRVYEAERRISDFLRDIAEYTTFGMPISESIVRASSSDYGSLSEEVKRVAALISWGVPVEDAMVDFGKKFHSQDIERAGTIIIRAAESGSNISDVMGMVSEFTSQMQLLRNAKFSEMKNYTAVMMISFGVFLFVILVLDLDFLPQLGTSTGASGLGFLNGANVDAIKNVFNIGMIMQGGGSGILSGVLRDGRVASGFFLAGILVLVSLVILLGVGAI
ncbi:MAG: type II secretion system F family protein [Candidatus Thermoplasmatota archaeon]|nr:type II secretion system F family protein [Candidatus Thermoplasmatota archaeon]